MNRTVGVVMAGGLGTRLWPWSRRARPKQFLPLLGERSLVRMTWDRLIQTTQPSDILLLTNAHLRDCARQEIPGLVETNLFGEPKSCNTAPCLALAAAICERRYSLDTVMVVLAADHYLGDEEGFQVSLRVAIDTAAQTDSLVTMGIPPTRPETGYGYLECDRKISDIPAGGTAKLVAFREKPPQETAVKYLSDGRHLWNMGNFIWRVETILSEFEKSLPGLLAAARKAASSENPGSEETLNEFFLTLPPECCQSIDYAIMEKASRILAVPCRIPWDDVGSWAVLRRLRAGDLDEQGNLSLIRHLAIDTSRTVVTGSESHEGIVVTLGVEDLIVVRDGERVLIAREEGLDQMREVVRRIQSQGWDHLL